jgi:NADPH-dependent curcumin reductase CurA
LEVAKIKPGETLVVSGAAGSVGSLVCQIGKIHGAKVVGIAGTDEKCRWLEEDIKIDAALNYKSPTFHQEFKDVVGYLDVFFDNVGGEILDFALTRLNKGARVALCGESNHEALCSESPMMMFARCHL